MSWFSNKPALAALLPFLAGLLLAYYGELPILALFVLLFLSLVLHLVLLAKKIISPITLFLMLFLVGLLHLELQTHMFAVNHVKEFADLPYLVAVEGVICRPVENSNNGQVTVLESDSIWILNQAYSTRGKCLLRLYEPQQGLTYGDRIVARGQLRLPTGERNPGEFNYQKYLAAQDIHAVLSVLSSSHLLLLHENEGDFLLARIVYPVRDFIIAVIDSSLTGQPAALLKALLIGLRGDLDDEIRQSFVNVGVIHVLAVSGLHVGFVLAGLLGFFSFLRIPNPWRIYTVMLCLVLYAFLTGLIPSVFRATVMVVVHLFGQLLQRRAHLLNTLAIAAFIILAISPLTLFEPGFQLSFMAVVGIVLIYGRISRWLAPSTTRMRERGHIILIGVINMFAVSVAAQIATMPLTVYYFNRLSLISFFANLIVIPATALIVALGMIAVFLSIFFWGLGAVYFNNVWLLLSGLIVFVDIAQHVPMAYLILPRPGLFVMSLYFFGVLLFLVWPKIKLRKAIIFLLAVFLNVFMWMSMGQPDRLKVTFFDVGQGDATLFEFPHGKTMLVDAGDCTEYVDYGERVVFPYLVQNGIKRIDFLVLTHAHSDHIGGAVHLLGKKCIGRIIKTHLQNDSELDRQIEELALHSGIPIQYVQAGDTLSVDPDILILFLHPTLQFIQRASANSSELNNSSIVFKCVYHQQSILMTGDAEKPAEFSLLAYDSLLCSPLVKLAHHGSNSAGCQTFRRALAANYGIVSVAKWNRFGLPSEPLLQEYEQEGTRILKTAQLGAVQFLVYPDKIVKM